MEATGIELHAPDSTGVAALSKEQFPYDAFMGKWHVVWSTLPLWNVSPGQYEWGFLGDADNALLAEQER